MRKYLISAIIAVLLAAVTPLCGYAASDYAYFVTGYDVNMVVFEDNSFTVTENIGVYFNEPRHGIFRALPLVNEITRLDGTKSKNHARVSGVEVSEQYTAYNEYGERVIKIGDPDETVTGAKDYTVIYRYDIGRDTGKGYDELYFNLVGEWDTTVSGISFTIAMPKEFDPDRLGFSAGVKTSTDSQNVNYTVNGTVITGSYDGTLNPGEYLTVRLELPDGYFVYTGGLDLFALASLLLPILFLAVIFSFWVRYGRDDRVVETVEFYPPEGYNSAEIGFIYKGKAVDKDVISLLIDLANKGYIAIEETGKKILSSKTPDYKITKVRDYDGYNSNEEAFLRGLFGGNVPRVDSAEVSDVVTYSGLRNSFYLTIERIKANLNAKENKEKLFEKNPPGRSMLGVAFAILTFVLVTARPILDIHKPDALLFALLFPGIGFGVLAGALMLNIPEKSAKKTKGYMGLFLWAGLFGGVPWATIVLPALLIDPMDLLIHLVGLACIAVTLVLVKHMPRRTPHGNELLGKIRGFRNFLITAEKPKLERLVLDEPAYFYNILPYTYVLGVSDKWIKKFETIALQAPEWYCGTGSFNAKGFSSFAGSAMTSAASALSPRSSSGSGGGSSGGGSGGGRGGSW